MPSSAATNVKLAGRPAWESLLANAMVPTYPVATLPLDVLAVTMTLNGPPAVTAVGALTVNWVAAYGEGSKKSPLITGLALDSLVTVMITSPVTLHWR